MTPRRHSVLTFIATVSLVTALSAQRTLPPLPDSTGWGVHVLTVQKDPRGSLWVGTYGRGIYRLRPGASTWEHITSDTTSTAISFDFVNGFGFGPRGEIWYGTVGNGWGVSLDDGKTWRNWTLKELGPEWQYVAPNGIVTRADTTIIGTADGIQITTDDGAHWVAVGDSIGPAAKGPADTVFPLLHSEYVRSFWRTPDGVGAGTLWGAEFLRADSESWRYANDSRPRERTRSITGAIAATPAWYATPCGLSRTRVRRCLSGGSVTGVKRPAALLTTWFRRPIDSTTGSPYIDQTYRYGSTMGGYFQQHQGVEFNNPDGTPVHAIGPGVVVYADRAEAGALTVAIRHDTTIAADDTRYFVFSVYYHNSALLVHVGDRVKAGDEISRVGNTGRATNDHLHLEVHASPTDSVRAIVDSLNRYPSYTTNPELWIRPLPGTGVVAGQVWDSAGKPVLQARIYGIVKSQPIETPFSFIETYGTRAHSHPLYHDHFALGDVPAGEYTLGVEIDGRKVLRRIRVEPGKVTWVEFRPFR
ncbi:MAG: M23 family metallopeptidase [Gemmatimonadota bacterium]